MIELTSWQWQNSHRQRAQFVVVNDGVGTKSATEFRIEVILDNLAILLGMFHKSLNSPVGK